MTTTGLGKRLIVACPHGFCAGVVRAVAMARSILKKHGRPVYCLNEIVHNQMVVGQLESEGMIFVTDPADIPAGAAVLFSAHGVSPAVRTTIGSRAARVIDATCPFVTKVHAEVRRFADAGFGILMIGKPYHEEVKGVVGECPDLVQVVPDERAAIDVAVADPDKVAVVMQTTLSLQDAERVLAALRERFPALRRPDKSDICYATQNRQQAVRELAGRVEYIVVLGAHNSSNSNRLVEVALEAECPATLVNSHDELDAIDLSPVARLGLTAGASTPESFVESAVAHLRTKGFTVVEMLESTDEHMAFSMPQDLRD